MIQSPPCTICNSGPDSTLHALRDCSTAKAVSLLLGFKHDNMFWRVYSGPQWLELIGETLSDLKDVFYVIAWFLWYKQNSMLHDSNLWDCTCIFNKTKILLTEFYETTEVEGSLRHGHSHLHNV